MGGGRAKSYDGEKAWFSINHEKLSEEALFPVHKIVTDVTKS